MRKQLIEDVEALPASAGVYLLTHFVTGDTYVGSSQNLRTRIKLHFAAFRRGTGLNSLFDPLAESHGLKFKGEILEQNIGSGLRDRERYWMDRIRPTLNVAERCVGPESKGDGTLTLVQAYVPTQHVLRFKAAVTLRGQNMTEAIAQFIEATAATMPEMHKPKPHAKPPRPPR